MKKVFRYFTKGELVLWLGSAAVIAAVFFAFDREGYLSLIASLVGVTSLIFSAKGNPLGQLLMIAFSLLYGVISLAFSYYGEMLTYMGMTMPMAVFALISWLKNPFDKGSPEVKISRLSRRGWALMWALAAVVTLGFYFILDYFNTAYIFPSTVSVTTSFVAVYLTFKRSPYYAVGYAANDVVLIVLWTLAALEDISYLPVAVCFAAFLVNDIYGFINWRRMEKRQAGAA